jgi:hypothetical protein
MSGYDQRDLDDELLGPPPNMLNLDPPEGTLQQMLDKATGGGLYPHWDNRADRRKTDDTCVVYHGTRRCYRDATDRAWIGCAHEHIAPSDVCGFHAIEIETARFGWRCSLCWDASGTVVMAYFIRREPLPDAELVRDE